MAINKVVYGNSTLIDLTEDTVSANNLLAGETAHDRSGAPVVGSVVTAEVVDNLTTQDATKALSAKQGYVLNQNKVDKVTGKGLSTNDYTTEEKTKLAGISAGAEPNVQSDWKQSDSSSDDFIKNKPTSEIQTSNDGQFDTITGGLMQKCEVDLEPKQSGSGTPSPSNVRPINGHTSVSVGNRGKNIIEVTAESQTISSVTFTVNRDANGSLINITANGTSTGWTNYIINSSIKIKAGTYTFSGAPALGTNAYISIREQDGTELIYTNNNNEVTLTLNEDKNLKVQIVLRGQVTFNNATFYPMLRYSTDTDPTYEPYNGYTKVINLGGTYYGGTLDAVSGVFTVTHALVDLGTLTYTAQTSISSFYATLSDAPTGATGTTMNAICSQYSVVQTKGSVSEMMAQGDNIFAMQNGSKLLFIKDTSKASMSASDFKTAMSGVQLCYELATPFTIQLDPQTLETLVGQNDVFAPLDGQSVEEVEYREVLAFEDVPKAILYENVAPEIGTGEMFTYFRIYRYGRVVVLTFMQDSMIEIPTQATRKIFGVLPERFYTKKSGAMPYNTIKYTFINQKGFGVFAPKLLEIDPTNGNVYADYEADEGICPMGSITYILDHD